MPISIIHKPIDLHSFKVTTPFKEMIALEEIQGQIKKCLCQANVNPYDTETLLINKLVYYSVREIQDKINPDLKISMGWYKYGPCFEYMRSNEMDRYTFQIERTSNDPVEEIIKNCKIETPKFLESRKEIMTPQGRYFYSYLKHIYYDRVDDVPELKEFYQTKHELSHEAYLQAFSPKHIDSQKLEKLIFNFNKTILDSHYTKKVGLEVSLLDQVQDFLYTFQTIMLRNNELREKNETDVELEAYTKTMALKFEDLVLSIFAYKNYKATYTDVDEEKDSKNKALFEEQVQINLKRAYHLLQDNIETVEKIGIGGN